MKPMTIKQYEELTRHDRESWDGDGTDLVARSLFPMTEEAAARLLSDCGLKGAYSWLDHFRERGEIAATEDAWGRAAVIEAWKRMEDLGSVALNVFACHALDVSYYDFWVAYLAASDRVRDEFGGIPPVAGMFGRHELVSFEAFMKVFHPVSGDADRGRVEFILTADARAAFEAAKARRQ